MKEQSSKSRISLIPMSSKMYQSIDNDMEKAFDDRVDLIVPNTAVQSDEANQLEYLKSCKICWHRHPRLSCFVIMLLFCTVPFIICTLVMSALLESSAVNQPNNNNKNNNNENAMDRFSITSYGGVVASDVSSCSTMGADILRQGGNAVDAAVTVTLCLGALNPASSGIGGGCFILTHNASTLENTFIDSRETAPSASYPDIFHGNVSLAQNGGLAVAVLAELRGLHLAWEKFGSRNLSWQQLVEPVISAAEVVAVTPMLAALIVEASHDVDLNSGAYEELCAMIMNTDGSLKREGDKILRPKYAQTLRLIGQYGPEYLFQNLSDVLAAEVRAVGGIITGEDIRSYQPLLMRPIETSVFGYRYIGAAGSSSGGYVIAAVLKYMAGYAEPFVSLGNLYFHRLAEAMKHAFAMRMSLGDPSFINTTTVVEAMLSDPYIAALRISSSDTSTLGLTAYGGRFNMTARTLPRVDKGTSHVSIVDRWGNAVSLTSTVNTYFGAKVVSPTTGLVWNNEMDDFSLPDAANYFGLIPNTNNFPEPGKRPLSSMSPSMVLSPAGKVWLVGGGSGGPRIITATVQVFLNVICRGMDLLTAVVAPRVHSQLLPDLLFAENNTWVSEVHIEIPVGVRSSLETKGHTLVTLGSFGNTQFVEIDRDTGLRQAVCDPRKDGRPAAD